MATTYNLEYKDTWDMKGKGVFTKVAIAAGTVISPMFESLTEEQKAQYFTLYAVKRYEDDDASMLDYFQNVYTKADGSKLSDFEARRYARVFVIVWCNYIAFYDQDGVEHRGLWLKASRFNHKCSPNLLMNIKTNGEMTLRARHLIPEGAELTFSYIPLGKFRAERRRQLLQDFGFECACDLCDLEDLRPDAGQHEERLAILRLHDVGETMRLYRENEFNQLTVAECNARIARCQIRCVQYNRLLWNDYAFYELLNIADLWARLWQLTPNNTDPNNQRAVFATIEWRRCLNGACNLGRIVVDPNDWHLVDALRAAASATPVIIDPQTPAPEDPAAAEKAVTPDGRFLRSGARTVDPTGSLPMVSTPTPGWKTA
ncbi:hypothetical protein PG993_011602 [Apiospora rasikravindrae]|uniref:SET domain-containing protein n=1 Tax=Apiospora rasikravindrae TaxID=990691 RepID=A0ABR1S029_9PEZI